MWRWCADKGKLAGCVVAGGVVSHHVGGTGSAARADVTTDVLVPGAVDGGACDDGVARRAGVCADRVGDGAVVCVSCQSSHVGTDRGLDGVARPSNRPGYRDVCG